MGNQGAKDYVERSTTQTCASQQTPCTSSQHNPNNVCQQTPCTSSQHNPNNVCQQTRNTSSQRNRGTSSQRNPGTSTQQKINIKKVQRTDINQKRSRKNSRHRGHSDRDVQVTNLNDFMKICDDFENALKIVWVSQKSKNSVHQRLQNIHKILVEKTSTLEKSNDNNSNETGKEMKMSSNLSSHNKSLSSSTKNVDSKRSLQELPDLTSYREFLKEVNCPFCDKHQHDKYYLIKHLDEDCLSFRSNSFKKETNLPYSPLQILPKNNFKCNVCLNVTLRDLQGYFNHINSSSHRETFKIKCSSKSYTDSLFCSICKIIVPNNFTELIMHVEHEQHRKRQAKFVNEAIFKEKEIICVYYKTGEYFCIACSKRFTNKNSLVAFMKHLTSDEHKQILKKQSIYATKVFCEICEKELNASEIWHHFRSLEHNGKSLEQKCTQYYTLCVYCSSVFFDLKDLANHMKSECKEMVILRNDRLMPGNEASGKSSLMEKRAAEIEEVIDGRCLFFDVSDEWDVSELKNYFENFGRVISLNKITGNKFMITFKERDTMSKILNFKKSIAVNSRIFNLSESLGEKVENQSNQSESDEENDTSDDDSSRDDEEIENIFQEVGSHLLKNVETMGSAEDDEILLISQMTLKGTMTFSGFRACHLFTPNETRLNMFCQFETQTYNSVVEDLVMKQNERVVKDSVKLVNGLSQVALELIRSSPFWEQAECISAGISYVKCIHKRTRKSCVFTFSDSDRELTDALSACLKENDFIKPFLLMLKLWMSSQETFLSDIEYPVIAVILFFLTSKSLVRPFPVTEHPVHLKILRALPDDNDLNANKPVKEITEESISKLFQMFLEFLDTFDFQKYAICFPLSKPVPRTILTKMLNSEDYSKSRIWIMNTSCTWNYTVNVGEEESRFFLNLVNKTLQEI